MQYKHALIHLLFANKRIALRAIMFSTYTLKTIFYLLRGNKGSEQFTAVNGYVLVCVLWTPHEKKEYNFCAFTSAIKLKHCKYEIFDHNLYRSTVRMLITFTLTCMYTTTSDTQVLQIRNTLNSHFISYTLLELSRTFRTALILQEAAGNILQGF